MAVADWLPIKESRFLAWLGGRVHRCALSRRCPAPLDFSLLVREETWTMEVVSMAVVTMICFDHL